MVNEKATFSNQKHKQELAGLNSIQICHFSQAMFVEFKFFIDREWGGGRSEGELCRWGFTAANFPNERKELCLCVFPCKEQVHLPIVQR